MRVCDRCREPIKEGTHNEITLNTKKFEICHTCANVYIVDIANFRKTGLQKFADAFK